MAFLTSPDVHPHPCADHQPHLFPLRIWQGLLLMILSLLCRPWTNRMKIREVVLSPMPTLPGPCPISCPQRVLPTGIVKASPPPGKPPGLMLCFLCVLWIVPTSRTLANATLATTHNVIHKITGGPDHKQADQRCKECEPRQCGDLGDALWGPDVTSSTFPSSFRPGPCLLSPPGHNPGFSRLPLLSLLQTAARGGEAG